MSVDTGPLVEARDARKRYAPGGAGALAGVTLAAGPGVTAVVGPNGAGKTTLLSLCLGFLRPTSGTVVVDGSSPAAWLRRRGAGYVPERFAPPGAWRPARALPALARLAGAGDPGGAARGAIERFGLASLGGSRAERLSRGELQRFALAQACVGSPLLLVLDEPELGLDAPGWASLVDWIEERRTGGATVLLATHDAGLAARLADAVVVLSGGTVQELIVPDGAARAPAAYDVGLDEPHELLGRWAGSSVPLREATVPVDGSDDLGERVCALVAAGARLVRLAPAASALELRIRAALSGGAREGRDGDPRPEGSR